jgi:hypothetical protein
LPQGAGDRFDAQAIGIALDCCTTGGLAGLLAEEAVIGLQGGEINRQDSAREICGNGIRDHGALAISHGWTGCNG